MYLVVVVFLFVFFTVPVLMLCRYVLLLFSMYLLQIFFFIFYHGLYEQ